MGPPDTAFVVAAKRTAVPYPAGMPLFVFECSRCSHRFEDLVRPDERPACPQCGALQTKRQLPRVAVQAGARSSEVQAPGSCGSCGDPRGPGACQWN